MTWHVYELLYVVILNEVSFNTQPLCIIRDLYIFGSDKATNCWILFVVVQFICSGLFSLAPE